MKFSGSESSTLEFKREIPSKQQILKTVIAFCNRHGGKLILGVEDSGEIIGLEENAINEVIDMLYQSIYNGCTPSIIPNIRTQRIDGKYIIIIEVSSGMNKPYFRSTEGLHNGTYIRLGTTTTKASAQTIQELQWISRGRRPDEIPVESATLNDINFIQFLDFLQRKLGWRPDTTTTEESLHKYECIVQEHQRLFPTLAGILLFGNEPQKFFPEAFIICTHFQGTEGRNVLATLDCTGTLFKQYQDALAFLQQRLYRKFTITDAGRRNEEIEIPLEALREALLNTIIHRNYHLQAPIKLAIYDDRVEFFSPGDFPGPIKKEEFEMGYSWIRNNIICRIFREDGFIEKIGSGFRTIFQAYRDRKMDTPIINERSGYVKCILPRASQESVPRDTLSERTEEVLQLFYLENEVKIPAVMKKLQVSRQTASRILSEMVAKNLIKRVGRGAGTKYTKK